MTHTHRIGEGFTIINGDSLEVLKTLPDNSIDAIITDPPYEIGFLGNGWDSTGIAYNVELWKQALRLQKPGGHALVFGATRTYHRVAAAIEDAGFEIRDSMHWVYGQGFPKGLNVSKAIDKAAGAEREVIGQRIVPVGHAFRGNGVTKLMDITRPATDDAKRWDGWNTALRPAHEPIVVARKPLDGTVVENLLQYGVGAINIEATRNGDRFPANFMFEEGQAPVEGADYFPAFAYQGKAGQEERPINPETNVGHPTVKPLELMRWLIRLVTPQGGTVLEPFAGSGTTVEAALLEDCKVIAIDLEADHMPLIDARIDRYQRGESPVREMKLRKQLLTDNLVLF